MDGGPHPFPNNRIVIDVTELKDYLSSKQMFMQFFDGTESLDTGWILDFEIEFYNIYDTGGRADSIFVTSASPVSTANNNTSTLILTVADTQISYCTKTIATSYHTIVIDGINDFVSSELIDSCITESSWGSNNNLDTLYLTYNSDTLYIGLTGKFDDPSNNYVLCYIDRDFGFNTGVKHYLSLSDDTENPDNSISNWINSSYMGGGGFGAELAAGWNGSSQTGGIRRFENQSKYNNFDWITKAQVSGTGQFFECAIPFSEIYNDISLDGKKIGVYVMLCNTDGSYISNQFIPDSALVKQQIAVIEIDRNNNGVPDNNTESETLYSIAIKFPLTNIDTFSQMIRVSGTSFNSKSGDTIVLYVNGIQQSSAFELSLINQEWLFDTASLVSGTNIISVNLISGSAVIASDTVIVNYYYINYICPANETASYNIYVSNIIGTDSSYTISLNNTDSVFITVSNFFESDSWSILINPVDTGSYVVLSSPGQNFINYTDTSKIKTYRYGENAMLKIDVYDSVFCSVQSSYFSDSPVITFNYSSKNITTDYSFLRFYYLNSSDSKWYEATDSESGAAPGSNYNLSMINSLLSIPVQHLSHWWIGAEYDSVTVLKGIDISQDTALAGDTFTAGSVFIIGDTIAGDTLILFKISNEGNLDSSSIDYISLYEDGNILGNYESLSDTFVGCLNLSGSSWVNDLLHYNFSNYDTGNYFVITVKTKTTTDSGSTFKLLLPEYSVKSFDEDSGPLIQITEFDTIIINTISGGASVSGPASISFTYPTTTPVKIDTSAVEITVGGTMSNAYPGYTVKIFVNNINCSTIILTLSDSVFFSCPVSLTTNPETNYISVYIDSGGGGINPDAWDTITVNCTSVRINFTVDMRGIYNVDTVYIGSSDLGISGWNQYQMSKIGTSSVYTCTFVLSKNTDVSYKFLYSSAGDTVYEYPYSNSYKYLFVHPHSQSYSNISVRGDWDGWVGSVNLTLDTDGYWRGSKLLNAGRYEYKFVVNGTDWYLDPYNPIGKNGNSYLGIDALPTTSALREISILQNDVIEYKNWEDTPLNFVGITVTPIDIDKIQVSWDTTLINKIEDAETVIIKYITAEDTMNILTAANVSVNTNVYVHSGLNNDSLYFYYIYVEDGSGNTGRFSELKYGRPLNMSTALIIADIGFDADTVEIGGDFNEWNYNNQLLKLSDGRWGCALSIASSVEYGYKLRVNRLIYEENAEHEFLYYDSTHSADSIYFRGEINSWELSDSYRLRKIEETDTWVIWLKGITDGMQYKFFIDGAWEPDPNRTVSNSSNSINRKLYLETSDTIEIDWSGRPNPPLNYNVYGYSDTSVLITFNANSDSDGFDSYIWKIYRTTERDSGYECKYTISSYDTFFIDSGLLPLTTYYYRITGMDSGIDSDWKLEGNFGTEDSGTTLSESFAYHISGIVDRQGNSIDSGINVLIYNGMETQSVVTGDTGYYSVTLHYHDTYVFKYFRTGYKEEIFVTYIDSDTILETVSLTAGDFFKDGYINAKDAAFLRKYYGNINQEYDIDGDNITGFHEKAFLKNNYFK
ncbi:hypothetical protein KA977_11100 [Candidatus Dependentiae bacterium]|nr:hypothetical protein [Candidatus Dependentiae bacterium]